MIKRLRVTVDGKTFDVTVEVPDDSASAATPASAAAPVAPSTPAPQQPVASAPPTPVPAAPAPAAASTASAPGDVPSPLAGRVTAVVVQTGQEVKEGDHLLTLEAMKMNTFVFAPKNGKVTAIKADVGAVVEEGQALITIG